MNRLLLYAALLATSQLAAGCQHDADIRPANYDELALGTGHWEWDYTGYQSGKRDPSTEGYRRQLVFGAGGQLLLRRTGLLLHQGSQPDYRTTYQLSMGTLPLCGTSQKSFPIITYSTNEEKLPNNERRTYSLVQQNGQQGLYITGEAACGDGGAYETYHWVAE
ncbi:hypothetical protein [Hymenobacter psoromatis]|uniref:hypothetical protein n=1 Tax=Hymenobacter psoromatis TaxID=1484116 RepID=UPI001CC0E63A|nr:hypothetical protein [Hymenobacter psoromatis]